MELLVSGLVGAVIGLLLERVFSIVAGIMIWFRFKKLRGTYQSVGPNGPNGHVVIDSGLGNEFTTHATQPEYRDWSGTFHFDDMHAGAARGVYRYDQSPDDVPDWGVHHLMLLPHGDIAVQWENISHALDLKGSVTWVRVPA